MNDRAEHRVDRPERVEDGRAHVQAFYFIPTHSWFIHPTPSPGAARGSPKRQPGALASRACITNRGPARMAIVRVRNCSGEFIKDLLLYFEPSLVFDPMTGSGTCKDLCTELGIACVSSDLREGFDACSPLGYPDLHVRFDFIWLHPPYWRMKRYSSDPRDMSNAPDLVEFLHQYRILIEKCASVLVPGGRMAILMGDYVDRDEGFVPLVYHTQRLGFEAGLKQKHTQIIRFSHGSRSSKKTYRCASFRDCTMSARSSRNDPYPFPIFCMHYCVFVMIGSHTNIEDGVCERSHRSMRTGPSIRIEAPSMCMSLR